MTSTQNLADLREQPLIGEVAYCFADGVIRPVLFHDFARTAYYLTIDALRNFETADAVGHGPFVVPAIAFWFMAVESYISTIYKACTVLEDSVQAVAWSPPNEPLARTDKVIEKMTTIKRWIAGECPPDPPRNRMQEFATFRNALFHDLTTHSPRTQYSHTKFSPRAEKCNQVDLIEAVHIVLEVFCYFRFIFRQADLMPSISIGPIAEKLDILVDEVIYPAYSAILATKSLVSPTVRPKHGACPAELLMAMQLLLRHDGPTVPRVTASTTDGELIVDKCQDEVIRARPVVSGHFRIPNYSRPAPTPD